MNKSIWLNRRFFVYVLGNMTNNVGNSFYALALPLLIFELTHSSINMSLMVACELIPLLFSPIVGSIVDRLSCRRVIFSALIFQSLCSAVIPLLNQAGVLQIWMLYVFGALLSLGGICLRTGQFVVVPHMFPEQRLEASSALTTGFTLTTIFGPFLAGWLLTMTSYNTILWINSLTFFAPILFCIYTRIPNEKRTEGLKSVRQILLDTQEGLRYVKNDKLLLRFFIIMATATLAGSGSVTIAIYHFKYVLSLPNNIAGWFMIALGVGDFIGTLLPLRFQHIDRMKLLAVFYLSSAVGSLLFLIPVWWVSPLALMASSIGAGAAGVSLNLQMQETVPVELLGRVSSSNRMIFSLTAAFSPIMMGVVTAKFSSYAAFGLMAVLYLLPTTIAFVTLANAMPLRINKKEHHLG
ncbi:MAG: MFS transporter [Tumebacillaceae bacterium]